MNIKIVKMTSRDVEKSKKTLVDFIFESNRMSAYTDSYTIDDASKKCNELAKYIENDQAIVFGAYSDDCLLGFVWAYVYPFREDHGRVYVSILHVDSEFRGHQIGKRLLDEVENEAQIMGYDKIFLHAEGSNDGARRFYERMGYDIERVQLVKNLIR